ncbi:fungal specific transcription factor domain-containing [Trichoderma arundinaceum]|uniref:Fungal specific transcription factor domain-containing n=1 Tax=Trichoderma arundinaceum TaxID=490622 RepID=A0A395NFG7_TRIAR|nr:fungal specific transcription factor domain-containing [Trichoderma arundinaceum]
MDGPISLSGAPKRKNGRPQACEPCRRRKVACDHRVPICSRCRRGGAPDKCVYLVQPSHQNHRIRHDSLSRSAAVPSLRPQAVLPHPAIPVNRSPPQTGNLSDNVGYLGATSFTAFYEEAQNSLSVTEKSEADSETMLPLKTVEGFPSLDELALSALRSIPDMASSKLLARLYGSFYGGWCPLAGEWLNESLWMTFGETLNRRARDEEQLRRMSCKLCRNGAIPLGENHTDPDMWFGEFSGPKMRWESLGILFVFWAYGARVLPDTRVIDKDCDDVHNHHANQLVSQYKMAAWKCIELSRDAANSNTLLAFLVFGHSLLESNVSGDAGMQYWRTHGDLMAMTTYLGLHVSPNHTDLMDCSISTQIKRRLFAAIFAHDKVAATFTGRPAFLSRRVSSTPLPLDMSDDVLLSSPPSADYRDCRVDENGWNIDGKIYLTTTLRARAMLSYVRDEILEIALQGMDFGGKTALLNLKKREMQVIAGFPAFILYQADDLNNPDVSGKDLYSKLLIWLEHLQNLFFIERLLSKEESEESRSRLFEISLEMVTLAHLFWTHQNRLKTVEDCVEWNTVSYAAPAGGILCMELLKGKTHGTMSPIATKAVIVEKLGMLAAFLDWVAPSSPNADICFRVKKVVRRVLEQALETPVQTNMLDEEGHWNIDISPDFNSFFNLDLLDTFEWLRPEGGS